MIFVLVSLTDHLQYPSQYNPTIPFSHNHYWLNKNISINIHNIITSFITTNTIGIEYKDDKKKSDGYSLKDGKKSTKTNELKVNNVNRYNHVYVEDDSKKKVDLTGYNTNSIQRWRNEFCCSLKLVNLVISITFNSIIFS